MKVILVRHAQTEWNQRGIIQGHMDSPLTKRGVLETSALLEALTEATYPTDCVYASPLGRAWHMGQALADRFLCPLVAEPALKEQAFGHYEGMTREQIQSSRVAICARCAVLSPWRRVADAGFSASYQFFAQPTSSSSIPDNMHCISWPSQPGRSGLAQRGKNR